MSNAPEEDPVVLCCPDCGMAVEIPDENIWDVYARQPFQCPRPRCGRLWKVKFEERTVFWLDEEVLP